jgi:hypothetical protein
MFKRVLAGLIVAMLTAPTMYAGAFPFSSSPGAIPWERIPQAAASAFCSHLGICFGSTP